MSDVPKVAGGIGAIASSLRHIARDSGVLRGARALLKINQPEGFDCPGCAWPEPSAEKRAHIEFCENGAKAVAEEADAKRATPDIFAEISIADLRLLTDFELGQLGRLTHPMYKAPGAAHYAAIAWDEAIAIAARELRAAGPAASAYYTSGRASNEAAFLYQLVGRLHGTNNFPDCSNMCHESSGVALSEQIGVGKGTVSLEDFDHADLVLVIGQNPGTNHPRMLTTLREVAKRGATIIAVNPLKEVGLSRFAHPQNPIDMVTGGVPLAKHFVQVPIGGDQALFLGVAKCVFEADAVDHAFVAVHCEGFAAYRAHVEATAWETIVARAGVPEAEIRELGRRYIAANATIACWAMGMTQHRHSVAMIQEIANVMLLRGNIGRPGAGLCPVRGHSNVQGDRTVGIDHAPKGEFLTKFAEVFGVACPEAHGHDTVDALHAMERGDVRAFVALGGNLVSAAPDTARTMRAFEGLALTVSIATKPNRTMLHPGAHGLVLPCLGRTERDAQGGEGVEQFVTVEDSMSMVHRSRGVLPPASPHCRSEVSIVCALGKAMGLASPAVDWDALAADYDGIRDLIARVFPKLFADFNARVRTPSGFQLPNSGRDRSFGPGGRAKFFVGEPPDLALPAGQLRLMTMRSHDQYNTTIYGLDDRYRGIHGERRVVFCAADDLAARGIAEREVIDLVSFWADGERRAEAFVAIPFDIPAGNCAAYFPEANALVPLGSVAARSNTPTSKSIAVELRKRPG